MEERVTWLVKDAALRMHVCLLGHIRRFVRSSPSASDADALPQLRLHTDEFVAATESRWRPYLNELVRTQMLDQLVQVMSQSARSIGEQCFTRNLASLRPEAPLSSV
jgi:hypothetical protein